MHAFWEVRVEKPMERGGERDRYNVEGTREGEIKDGGEVGRASALLLSTIVEIVVLFVNIFFLSLVLFMV